MDSLSEGVLLAQAAYDRKLVSMQENLQGLGKCPGMVGIRSRPPVSHHPPLTPSVAPVYLSSSRKLGPWLALGLGKWFSKSLWAEHKEQKKQSPVD